MHAKKMELAMRMVLARGERVEGVIGHWLLALVIGHWFIGHWSLVIGFLLMTNDQ